MRYIIVISITICAIIAGVYSPVFAQTSSNDRASRPTSAELLGWAKQISGALERGRWGYNNRMQADISNGYYSVDKQADNETSVTDNSLYWSTNLVIDAYNLSGKKGLGPTHQNVVSMVAFWKKEPGYIYLDYLREDKKSVMQRLHPGFAIFFMTNELQHTGKEHAAIVKTVNIDENGNGFIETYDSNGPVKIVKYPVSSWSIKNTPYPLTTFGGV